jgi:hypothetical protein
MVETINQSDESHGTLFNATHFSMEGHLHDQSDNDLRCRARGRGYCLRSRPKLIVEIEWK